MCVGNSVFVKYFKKLSNNDDVSILWTLKKIRGNSLLVIQPFFYNLCNPNSAVQRWDRREQNQNDYRP